MTQYNLMIRYSKYINVSVEAPDREAAEQIGEDFYQVVGLTPTVGDPKHFPLPDGVLSFEGDDEDLESVTILDDFSDDGDTIEPY